MPSRKILVVDNSSSIRRMVHNVLSREGYEVFIGVNGEDAMEMAFEEQPDLLIVEDRLPDFETAAVVEGICSENGKNGVRAIILADGPESSESWRNGVPGVARVLEKPFASRVLREAVNACFSEESVNAARATGAAQAQGTTGPPPPPDQPRPARQNQPAAQPPPPPATDEQPPAPQPATPFMTTPVHLPPGPEEELELEEPEPSAPAAPASSAQSKPGSPPPPPAAPAPAQRPQPQPGPVSAPAGNAQSPPAAQPAPAPPARPRPAPTEASPPPETPQSTQRHPQVKAHPSARTQPPETRLPQQQQAAPPQSNLSQQSAAAAAPTSASAPAAPPRPTPTPPPPSHTKVSPRPVLSPPQTGVDPEGGLPAGSGKYEIDVPAALVSGREVLVFISQQEWTGLCNIYCEEEVVEVFFVQGDIQMITSNNASIYVVDEEIPWREELILEAIEEQSISGQPLFITLNSREVRLTRAKIQRMVRKCGEEAIKRALAQRTTRIRFKKLAQMPDYVQHYGETQSMFQLLLVSYRVPQPWDRIAALVPNPGVIPGPTDYLESLGDELEFNDTEIEVIQYLDEQTSVGDIIRDLGKSARDVASTLCALSKLGLVELVYVPDESEGGRWEDWM